MEEQDIADGRDAPEPPGPRVRRSWTEPGPRQRFLALNLVASVVLAALGTGVLHSELAAARAASGLAGEPFQLAASEPPGSRLPTGKGMWIYEFPRTEGGDVGAIVARARAAGLTHLYVRAGSWADGFYAGPFLDRLLPVAHGAGLKVIGWDFPRLGGRWQSDVARAAAIAGYRTPGHHRLDAFSADIETPAEGTHISAPVALAYGRALREAVGPGFPLIATVPRPSPAHRPHYPYAEIVEQFDAIAPMVYWLNRQPDSDVAGALDHLAAFGKPVFPVGQAYDGRPEGGRPGVPPPDELLRFMRAARDKGASAVSFWSWQAADQRAWDTIGEAEF